jgi:hypothetical protein
MIEISTLTHHATLFTHEKRKEVSGIIWKNLKLQSIANVVYDVTVIDIDTARKLIAWSNTPYHEPKVAFLTFHSITIQAQNALLKLFEEPRKGIQFILVTHHKNTLLPTLLSRLEHRDLGEIIIPNNATQNHAEEFLTTHYSQRMKLPYIITLITRVDEEDRKDREGVKNFITSLAETISTKEKFSSHTLETLTMAAYAGDPSSSGKAILEYLSLLLPNS